MPILLHNNPNNLVPFPVTAHLLITSESSSNSALREFYDDIIENEEKKLLDNKLAILRRNIGDELFNNMNPRQRRFLAEVSGSISLGKGISFEEEIHDDA